MQPLGLCRAPRLLSCLPVFHRSCMIERVPRGEEGGGVGFPLLEMAFSLGVSTIGWLDWSVILAVSCQEEAVFLRVNGERKLCECHFAVD